MSSTKSEHDERLVDVLAKMDAIIHRQRGKHIANKGNGHSSADPLALDEFRTWQSDNDPKAR